MKWFGDNLKLEIIFKLLYVIFNFRDNLIKIRDINLSYYI